MKNIAVMVAAIATIASSSAATIAFTNLVGFDNTTNAVTDSKGVAYAAGTGYIGVGYFSMDDAALSASTDAQAIASSFVSLASGSFNTQFAGLYQFGSTNVNDAKFDGKNVYTIIGNAATLAGSTEFLIVKYTQTFAADPALTADAILSTSQSGNVATIIKGNVGAFTSDFGAGANAAYSTVLVPEASTALLGLLGVFGLVRRRR